MDTIKVKVDTSDIDDVTQKAERLNELLKKASSIIDELASKKEITLSVEVES